MNPKKIEFLNQEFLGLNKVLESFGHELSKQIQQILEENKINLGFPIQYRIKSWDSIERKLNNLSIKSILEIQDLCGLRFVLLFKRDISKIVAIIASNFKILRQYDTHQRLESDQFGYSSLHMIIEMPEKWFSIPTLKSFKGLKAEVQIRTLAQHTWASASHILQYKTEENVPKSILRAIYRVSAILETVDIEFERFLEEREGYIIKLNSLSVEEIAESKLNVNSLEKILDDILPLQNKSSDEEYSRLLEELKIYNINNSNELIELIEKHKEKVLEKDKNYSKVEKGQDYFFNHSGLLRLCLELESPQKWQVLLKKWDEEGIR